ncbi:unnamed protein product [Soboliphyme baturini]|uniref:Elongation of very long chain fatty acids protein n=1 Tax=Soboliphyme baturini TaxID=241478 RepID=A0A183IWG9_9BILA|nr:unnamed protein product [Soboliphyme baturini]
MSSGALVVNSSSPSSSFVEMSTRSGEWLEKNWSHCLYWLVAYMIFLKWGRQYMQDKQPLQLKKSLIVWNAFFACFSVIGSIRLFPEFYHTVMELGFWKSYCFVGTFYKGKYSYWVTLFHFSKLLELGDSVFLVLRKRSILFVHWYHHATVLVYSWFSYHYFTAPARWGVVMNLLVHSFMYTYYLFRSIGIRLPWFIAPCITTMQLMQFVLGTYICTDVFLRVMRRRSSCETDPTVAAIQLFLYFTFLVLFANFFYKSYICKKKLRKSE